MTTFDCVRFVKECYPEYKGQLFMQLEDLAKLCGFSVQGMRRVIHSNNIDYYRPEKRKMYCVLEVVDAILKTRNSS